MEIQTNEYKELIMENAEMRVQLDALKRLYESEDSVIFHRDIERITGWQKGEVDVIRTDDESCE